VTRGLFDASLYYRLNVTVVELERRQDFGFHAAVVPGEGFATETLARLLS